MFKLLHRLSDLLPVVLQAGVLFAAGLVAAMGLLVLGNRLYWRWRAIRVTGKVVGLRESGKNVFHTVYRYRLGDGPAIEATANTPTTSLARLTTGTKVPLWILKRRPDVATRADRHVAEIVGGALVLLGGVGVGVALIVWPVTQISWVVLGLAALFATLRLAESGPDLSSALGLGLGPQGDKLQALPVRSVEQVLSDRILERARGQRRAGRIVTPILVVVGVGVLALGVWLGRGAARLQAHGARAQGTVVSLEERSTLRSSSYYPVVSFTARDGTAVEFTDGVGNNPPNYAAGDQVKVLYLPESPEVSAIIDRGWGNWLAPLALCPLGSVLAWVSLRAGLADPRRYAPLDEPQPGGSRSEGRR